MQIREGSLADCTKESALSDDDKKDNRKIFCGNLSEKVTEVVLFELFLHAGPIESVEIPRTKDGRFRNYAFITYVHVNSVPYALKLFGDVKLYNRRLVLRNRRMPSDSVHAIDTKVDNSIVKTMPRDECLKSKRPPKNPRHRQRRNSSQSLPANKDGAASQKMKNTKPVPPRIPLRVNNECQVYRKILDNTESINRMNQLSQTSDMNRSVRGPEANQILNLNFPPGTVNLTSQLLSNYIFIMQKVIPHWPRLQ